MIQVALLCGCGSPDVFRRGMCRKCLRRQKLNVENFDGLRELVLLRDEFQCQVCGWDGTLVHHRRPGLNTMAKLITLCLIRASTPVPAEPRMTWGSAQFTPVPMDCLNSAWLLNQRAMGRYIKEIRESAKSGGSVLISPRSRVFQVEMLRLVRPDLFQPNWTLSPILKQNGPRPLTRHYTDAVGDCAAHFPENRPGLWQRDQERAWFLACGRWA